MRPLLPPAVVNRAMFEVNMELTLGVWSAV